MGVLKKIILNSSSSTASDSNNKGYFVDQTALEAAYPTGQDGWFAIVGSTDTVWTWDSDTSDWVNTGASGTSSFTGITSGTNTSAAMVVGTGGSLSTTGSGTIAATSVPASGITGSTLASGVTASSLTSLGTLTSLSINGDQTFIGSVRRIYGDFSNATKSNRLSFQSSTSNGTTGIAALPNGTAQVGSFFAHGGSDADNSAYAQFHCDSSGGHVGINSSKTGTGTTLPIKFQIDNTTKLSLDTSGNLNYVNATASTAAVFDSSKNLTSLAYNSVATASNLAQWDSNVNFAANNIIRNLTSVVTSGGTTTLTAASAGIIILTGSSSQNVVLPDATTLKLNTPYEIRKQSVGATAVIKDGAGNTLITTASDADFIVLAVTNISSTAGTWTVIARGSSSGSVAGSTAIRNTGGDLYSNSFFGVFKTTSSNIAASGTVRCASSDIIFSIRNQANSADLPLTKNTSDVLNWVGAMSLGANSGTGGSLQLFGSTSGSLTISVPAAAGSNTLKLPAGTTDFSATGGTSQVVKQTTAGGAFTVEQLAFSDISGTASNSQLASMADQTFKGNVSGVSAVPSDLTVTQVQGALNNNIVPESATSRTLVLTDAFKYIRTTNASAVTITVPTNASVAYEIGTQIDFWNQGTGLITFAASGGVTINYSSLTMSATKKAATLKKVGTDEWDLIIG